jgi:ribosome-interacting GTPase 1
MPANLPPQYLAAEKQFREAKSPEDKLAALRQMYALIPKHKGTDKLQADIKRRISRLQDESQKARKKGRRPPAWIVEPEGAGQVAVVGLPNAGKSRIVDELTGASPVVADYPFTTQLPQPAMAPFEDVQIQLVDCPPLFPGHTSHWYSDVLRHADAWMVILDLSEADPVSKLHECERELVRVLWPKGTGESMPALWSTKKTLFVGSKAEAQRAMERGEALRKALPDEGNLILVSAEGRVGIERLPEALFDLIEVIRIYSKQPGKKPDLSRPYVLPKGSTVLDVASAIHRDFVSGLRYARVWGSGRFQGQAVQKDLVLSDKDIVELHI